MVCTILLRIHLPLERLIHEIPDEASLIYRILTHEIPILLQTTHRVTHRMGILTLDQRLSRTRIP